VTYPHLEPVDSTSIEAVGYVEDAHELHVQFVSGGYYVYEGVPPATYQELMSADSLGAYLNLHIKPNHPYRFGP
jgi:hypothetical protein